MISQALSVETAAAAAVVENAAHIAPLTREEVDALAREAWKRLLDVVEALAPDDWSKPTPCTAWTVRDMVAHQAGAYAAYASFAEFRRQYFAMPPKGRLPEDVINEIREKGPRTITNRQRIPFFLRAITIPHPASGKLNLGYLLDVIFTRDTWMHRLDLVRATDREMKLTRAHDGRIVELVVRDVNALLAPGLGEDSLTLELGGVAGGAWLIGSNVNPRAGIWLDALDFNIFASGRYTFEQVRTKALIEGDREFGGQALRRVSVSY